MNGSELNSTHALVHTDTHCIHTYTYIHLSRTYTQTYIFSVKGRTVNDFIFSPRQSWCFPFIFPSMSFVEVPSDLIKWKSSLVPALDILPRQVAHFIQSVFLGFIHSFCLLFSIKGLLGGEAGPSVQKTLYSKLSWPLPWGPLLPFKIFTLSFVVCLSICFLWICSFLASKVVLCCC